MLQVRYGSERVRRLLSCQSTRYLLVKMLGRLSRGFSSASSHSEGLTEVRKVVLQVRPNYGTLNLRGDLHFVIKPDLEHLCGTVCSIRLLAPTGNKSSPSLSFQQSADLDELTIDARCTDECNEILPHCEIQLPIKYDLNAELCDRGSVEIVELQNDSTRIRSQRGSCIVHRLESFNMTYETDTGLLDIRQKLIGNLSATGNNLNITGRAVQAGQLVMKAPTVSCSLQYVHANTLLLEANVAHVKVKDVTADSQLSIQRSANIDIGNCSGSMTWQLEEATVKMGVPQLLQDSSVTINSGSCSVACPAEYRYDIVMLSPTVNVREGFSKLSYSTEQQENAASKVLQAVRGGTGGAVLTVLVKEGSLTLVPWCWPFTQH